MRSTCEHNNSQSSSFPFFSFSSSQSAKKTAKKVEWCQVIKERETAVTIAKNNVNPLTQSELSRIDLFTSLRCDPFILYRWIWWWRIRPFRPRRTTSVGPVFTSRSTYEKASGRNEPDSLILNCQLEATKRSTCWHNEQAADRYNRSTGHLSNSYSFIRSFLFNIQKKQLIFFSFVRFELICIG